MWVGDMGFWYYLLTYLLFDIVYTMILVPYETLVPEMTDDFKQKTKFSGARISMAQMSAILASFLPGVLLTILVKTTPFLSSMPAWCSRCCAPDADLRLVLYLGTPA
jgi:oligogalacturonide transporter